MGKIRLRPETGKLQFDFTYQGKRCREQTALPDSPANRRRLEKVLEKIEAKIVLGTFDYADFFPNSPRAAEFAPDRAQPASAHADSAADPAPETPLFRDFARQWFEEFAVYWRRTYRETLLSKLNRYLLPRFGDQEVGRIQRAEVLQFRSEIAKSRGRNRSGVLSPKTINDTFGLLSMILSEAANRYEFSNPCAGIKRLKVPRSDIAPFSLDEINRIIESVRADYRDYFIVRFFTGLRSGELHGLQWPYVDFKQRQIRVRQTYTHGAVEYTKTDGAQRDVDLSQPVYAALCRQYRRTADRSDFVFCTRDGTPLDTTNVTQRVWYPLLRYLGLTLRRPYQTRHTAATLWLAAGENPEWIARQMGHTTTEMLFRVYSRYVPNLTRQDGSAFDRFVTHALNSGTTEEDS